MLGPEGFDPARDITLITVNRWPHAYEYNPLFGPDWQKWEASHEVGRARFGPITIADSAAAACTDSAIDQPTGPCRNCLRASFAPIRDRGFESPEVRRSGLVGVRRTCICEGPSLQTLDPSREIRVTELPPHTRAATGDDRDRAREILHLSCLRWGLPSRADTSPPSASNPPLRLDHDVASLDSLDGCAGTSGAGPVRFGWVAVCRGCSYPHAGSNPPPGPQRSPH